MAWTYSGDPGTSNKDWVRWRVGDTDTSDQLQSDEEINAAISSWANKYRAAAEICRTIAAKFARRVDKSVGDLRISASQQKANYLMLAEELERTSTLRSAKPYAGGISVSDKDSVQDDSDRVTPAFSRDQFDHRETEQNEEYLST